jgi:hypothetical protein
MNKKIYIIFFVLLGFILNIFFYIFSENYRYFLKSLKSDNYNLNDEFQIKLDKIVKENKETEEEDSIFSGLKNDFVLEEKKQTKKIKKQINSKKDSKEKKEKVVEFKKELEKKFQITKVENEILSKFSKFKLKELELK